MMLRPHVREFLQSMAKIYEVCVKVMTQSDLILISVWLFFAPAASWPGMSIFYTFSFVLIYFISCFLFAYQNKFVVVFLWYLDVCSGLHVLSYSLCPLPVVCLHMCKERICWEDTEHPGPAEKAVSVCVLLLGHRDKNMVRIKGGWRWAPRCNLNLFEIQKKTLVCF